MAVWRRIRSSATILMLLVVVLYIGYCTEELYSRLQSNRKLQRLMEYEKEIDELTDMLGEYKKHANSVQKSIKLLKEAFSQLKLTRKPKAVSDRWYQPKFEDGKHLLIGHLMPTSTWIATGILCKKVLSCPFLLKYNIYISSLKEMEYLSELFFGVRYNQEVLYRTDLCRFNSMEGFANFINLPLRDLRLFQVWKTFYKL